MAHDPKVIEAVKHIDALMALAGLDKSESATEAFALYMQDACARANREVTRSHKDGLCLDTRWMIAEELCSC